MRITTGLAWILFSCGALIGCGGSGSTFVLLQIAKGPATPDHVTALRLDLTLNGQPAHSTLTEKGGAPISFPTSDTLAIANGAGTLDVVAVALDGDTEVDQGEGTIEVVRGKSATLSIQLGGGSGADLAGTADLAGSDAATVTVPGAPTAVIASSGVAQASVTWQPPASDGNSPILSYLVTANPGGATATATGLSTTFSGLTNGTPYTFTVSATNAIGTGPASDPSSPVTPLAAATIPGAPGTPTAVVGGPLTAQVTWTAANNNASPISHYQVTSTPGGFTAVTPDGNTLTANVSGLTAGVMYAFTVTATNGVGTGPASAASNLMTAIDVPSAPTSPGVCPASAQAKITFTLPGSASSANVYYRTTAGVTKANGTKVAGVSSPATITGLTNGSTYYFVVTAVNGAGESVTSTEVSALVSPTVRDTLFVVNGGTTGSLDIFDCFTTLPNNATPTRSVTDASFGSPQYGSVAIDSAHGIAYAISMKSSPFSVLIWDNATTINGAVAPNRTLGGSTNTNFSSMRGLAVDYFHKRLYVSDAGGGHGVRGWANSDTVSGDAVPVFTITGISSVNQLSYDLNSDRLFVISYTGGAYVFNSASTLSGTIAGSSANKIFTVTGGTSYIGVAAENSTLYFGEYAAPGHVYSLASYATATSGAVTASTTLSLSDNTLMIANISVANNLLFALPDNDASHRIFQYNGATGVNGTATPDKTVTISPHTTPFALQYLP